MVDKKINRLVTFIAAPAYDAEAEYPKDNNVFQYFRAPEGYLYELVAIDISVAQSASTFQGIVALSDGHVYTGWNIFPGVEDRELLWRAETNVYIINGYGNLHGWECKEFTLGARSLSASYGYKACCIIWYYLKKASREELLEYALKHPVREDTFKALLGQYSTVNQEEE